MTLRGRLFSLFPALHFCAIAAACIAFILTRSLPVLLTIPATAYLLPLAAFHMHNRLWRLEEGTFSIVQGYSPWFGTHMIQQGFIAMPFLEEVLRLFPGLFALWLRAWGARIGQGVYFAPAFEIGDRSLIEVGDGVVFGYGVKMSSHVISPSRSHGGMKIYIKKVSFGERSFVGSSSRFGPGVVVHPRALVRATSDHFPDAVIEKQEREG